MIRSYCSTFRWFGVALFFFLSALFHFIVASPWFFDRYARGLGERHNYFRWVEYSPSSSVMIVLIAQIVGISDFAALLGLFGVNASMILSAGCRRSTRTPAAECRSVRVRVPGRNHPVDRRRGDGDLAGINR